MGSPHSNKLIDNQRGWAWAPSPLLAVTNVTTASVPTSYYLMWQYNCLWIQRVKAYL